MNFPDLASEITDALNQVRHAAGDRPDRLASASTATARITDLEINTQTSTYGVGLALDFTHQYATPELFGINIALLSLGFKVTRVNAAATTP